MRIGLEEVGEPGKRRRGRLHRAGDLKARQYPIPGGGVMREDDVARLLAAEHGAGFAHSLGDELVPYGGRAHLDAAVLEALDQAQVGHHRDHDEVAVQSLPLL